jgi:hypothetical protein
MPLHDSSRTWAGHLVHKDGASDAAAPGDAFRLQCAIIRHHDQLHLRSMDVQCGCGSPCHRGAREAQDWVARRRRPPQPSAQSSACWDSMLRMGRLRILLKHCLPAW